MGWFVWCDIAIIRLSWVQITRPKRDSFASIGFNGALNKHEEVFRKEDPFRLDELRSVYN
jgi:hypothetical protein